MQKLFNGEIKLVKNPENYTNGVNTLFQLTFPLSNLQVQKEDVENTFASSTSLPKSNPQIIHDKSSLNKENILIVDDNLQIQDYLRILLEDNYTVYSADHGQMALEEMQKDINFSLIISDMMMPVMDGYELLTQLKSDPSTRNIPVIMLTALAESRDRLHALRIGVDDYLTKPFIADELLARVENLINNYSARSQSSKVNNNDFVSVSDEDQAWIESFEKHVKEKISDPSYTVTRLAHDLAMSESTLLRQVKKLIGMTPKGYMLETKLNLALDLLENKKYKTVSEIARHIGYGDVRSFSRRFKSRFGRLPSSYLEK